MVKFIVKYFLGALSDSSVLPLDREAKQGCKLEGLIQKRAREIQLGDHCWTIHPCPFLDFSQGIDAANHVRQSDLRILVEVTAARHITF